MKGYELGTNVAKDENGDLVADSHSVLNRWKSYFCHLLTVHGVNDFREAELHTAGTLLSEVSSFEFQIAIEKLKGYKSPGTDQLLAEVIQAGDNSLHSGIRKLINYIYSREELSQQWKESITEPIYKKGEKTDFSVYTEISLLQTTYKF
jgi:hypothetical protein